MVYFEFYEYDLQYPKNSVLNKGTIKVGCRLLVSNDTMRKDDEERCKENIKGFLRTYVQFKVLVSLHRLQPFTVWYKDDVSYISDSNIGCKIERVRCNTCEDNNYELIKDMIDWVHTYYNNFETCLLVKGIDTIPLDVIEKGMEGNIDLMLSIRLLTKDSECDLHNLVVRPYHHTMLYNFGNSVNWLKRTLPHMQHNGNRVQTDYEEQIFWLLDNIETVDVSNTIEKLHGKDVLDTTKLN